MRLPVRIVAAATLLCAATAIPLKTVGAEELDFDRIDRFESLGTGTIHVGDPPKAIVDDGQRHLIILTIWRSDAEIKVYWRSPDGNVPQITIIPSKGVQTFETVGELRLEAVGEPNRGVEYGYVLLGLRTK
jgi:hypothetical protein